MNNERYPLSGTFELTGRCNLNCKMCYVHVDQKRIDELGYVERSKEEWIDMAHQLIEAGTFSLLLTGGEPMIRSDFCEIYEAIAQMGFYLTLYTNATMITPKIMEVLKKYPPHIIGVTVYGASNQTYERLCGHKQGFTKVVEGINQLLELPSKIEIRTTLVKENIHEEKAITQFVKSFGERVTFNLNQTVYKSSRQSIACPEKSRLTPRENAETYCRRYITLTEEYLQNPNVLNEIRRDEEKRIKEKLKKEKGINEEYQEKIDTPYGCNAGINEFTISWDGRLLPCTLLGNVYTYPFNDSFNKAWESLEEKMIRPTLPNQCLECSDQEFCGICVACRQAETGDMKGIPHYFCELAREYTNILKKGK